LPFAVEHTSDFGAEVIAVRFDRLECHAFSAVGSAAFLTILVGCTSCHAIIFFYVFVDTKSMTIVPFKVGSGTVSLFPDSQFCAQFSMPLVIRILGSQRYALGAHHCALRLIIALGFISCLKVDAADTCFTLILSIKLSGSKFSGLVEFELTEIAVAAAIS
jgi:hypothetical protein